MSQHIVIARGFEGEPAKMLAVGAEKGRVQVISPASLSRFQNGETTPVSVMARDVFDYEEGLFARLKAAYLKAGQLSETDWQTLAVRASRG